MISCAVIVMSTALRNDSTLNRPSLSANFSKLRDARLQAESSRNMYSEQGFEALIGAVFLDVCQRLTVVSYCIPGSPQMYADSAIMRIMSRALKVSTGSPVTTARVLQSPSLITACMNSSVTRTLWFAFWKKIDE